MMMLIRRSSRMAGLSLGLVATLMFACLTGPSRADDDNDDGKAPPKSIAKMSPEVKSVLENWEKHVKKLNAFSFEAKTTIKAKKSPTQTLTQTVRFQRPGQMSVVYTKNSGSSINLLADGKDFHYWIPARRIHHSKPIGESLDDSLAQPEFDGVPRVLMAVCANNPLDLLLNGVSEVLYEGKAKVGDRTCHHLKFVHDSVSWQMWIDASSEPLIRKIEPDSAQQLAHNAKLANPDNKSDQDDKETKASTIEIACAISKWSDKPKFNKTSFELGSTITKNAEKADSLADLFKEKPAAEAPAKGNAQSLAGFAAPNFTLPFLAGGMRELASHQKKNIVILDFWATWCGPCRQSMPAIAKVASDYQDRGVILYAVNIQEPPDEVRQFLIKQKWDIPVLLDQKGEVAKAYRANAIPETVIVGPDGKVHVVHVGSSPGLEAQLRKELDQLLLTFPYNPSAPADNKASSKKSSKK